MGALASFGRDYTIFSAIISTFVGIFLIVWGVWLWVGGQFIGKHNDKSPALLLIIFGVLLILISWFWVWLSQKYETVADIEGVEGIYRLI